MTPLAKFGEEGLREFIDQEDEERAPSFEEIIIEFKDKVAKKYGSNLTPKFVKYYESLGQQKKAMDLSEELEKINNMTDEEFERFLSTVRS
ncbi:MAG: hypothetical protein JST59_00065 [Actinobacteria bacterium]|nr:hypothetical protein [Actinomycetota bacterium]